MAAPDDRFSRVSALRPARELPQRPPALRAPEEDDRLARLVGAGVAKNHFGEHLALRNWFSTPESFEPSEIALELLARRRDIALSRRTRTALEDPARWLFLDTETTGLAGGTGTYAFLIGIAWWDGGGLQVEQFFMRDFSDEYSLLHELALRLAERPVLVTFNGKSFDWPLLENRFTMTRSIRVPNLSAHLDLLHPARALWKLRLGSVRLIELERHALDARRLGWQRDDDISSAMIPQYYFDYLRGGPCDPLVGVVRHNQMDLRGLAALFAKINWLLASQAAERHRVDSLDLFGLSRFLERRGEADRARVACTQALDGGLPAEFRPRARRDLAMLAKRRDDHEQAASLWRELLLCDSEDGVVACEQLAIHYERHAKSPALAAEFAQLGLAKLQPMSAHARDVFSANRASRWMEKFRKRISRLQKKVEHHKRDEVRVSAQNAEMAAGC